MQPLSIELMSNITMHWKELNKTIGNIDIYWLDFILKGYLKDDARVLDVGCGEGRNLIYCMQNSYNVFGIDKDPRAIDYIRLVAKTLQIDNLEGRFRLMDAKKMIFPDQSFDVVLSSAMFHFAESRADFKSMWSECLRVIKPGGIFFVRTMTSHYNSEADDTVSTGGIYTFADGQKRYLLNAHFIKNISAKYNLEWIEPFKYVVVDEKYAMAVLVLRKNLV